MTVKWPFWSTLLAVVWIGSIVASEAAVLPAVNQPEPRINGRFVVAVIGIDDYRNWPRLDNAVQDALGTQAVLVEKFGFEAPIEPVLNEDATRDRIQRLIEDDLREALSEDDNLVLFFAGHGHTRTDSVGGRDVDSGYLVPVDSRFGSDERWSDYIEIETFLRQVGRLNARHILVILDSCHSGFALSGADKFRGNANFAETLQSNTSRVVITSARKDEAAIDNGPVPGHSLFSGTLIEGLNRGGADLDNNKLVTSYEIGLYLQQSVGNASGSRQIPDTGSFFLDDRGQMVIPVTIGASAEAIKRQAYGALSRGQLSEVRQLVSELEAAGDATPDVEYLEYRLHLAGKNALGAERRLAALEDLGVRDGSIPLSRHDIEVARVRVKYWNQYLDLETDTFPFRLEFLSGPDPDDLTTRQPFNDESFEGFEIVANSFMRIRATNQTDEAYNLYMIDIDQEGRIEPVPLWASHLQASSVPPRTERESSVFRHVGTAGASEFRFFASKETIDALLFPLGTATRGAVPPADVLESDDTETTTLRYRAVLDLP